MDGSTGMNAEAIFQAILVFEGEQDLRQRGTIMGGYDIGKKRQLAEAIWMAQPFEVRAGTDGLVTS